MISSRISKRDPVRPHIILKSIVLIAMLFAFLVAVLVPGPNDSQAMNDGIPDQTHKIEINRLP